MMDIVERLRNNKGGESYTWQTISEAADEIERLRSRLEKPTPAMLEAGRAANRMVAGNALGLAFVAPDVAWSAMANLVLSEDK
jgi:hypothetical protein